MIFYIHIIFQPFQSFIHVIYLQNFIIHLQMDPGDQLYTLDELRCWKVENLRVLDDDRSNEGGASGLVFFGMQVELAFGAITR
jgi:hypothetical protein